MQIAAIQQAIQAFEDVIADLDAEDGDGSRSLSGRRIRFALTRHGGDPLGSDHASRFDIFAFLVACRSNGGRGGPASPINMAASSAAKARTRSASSPIRPHPPRN